jgi:hypothetical protein
VWLCTVAERGDDPPQRRAASVPSLAARDVIRSRCELIPARTAKELPEDAQIKLSVVASDIVGVLG